MTGREKGEQAADSDSVYQPFDTSCSLPFRRFLWKLNMVWNLCSRLFKHSLQRFFGLDYTFLNLESKIQSGCLIRIHINVSRKLILLAECRFEKKKEHQTVSVV